MKTALTYVPESTAKAIDDLHQKPHRIVVYATGAGSGIQTALAAQPGASGTILEGGFPYSGISRIDVTGIGGKAVSIETAIALSGAAYARALEITQRDNKYTPVIGLGLTAAIESRRGDEEAFVAVKTSDDIQHVHIRFTKGELDRLQRDAICTQTGLNLILNSAGIGEIPYVAKKFALNGFKNEFTKYLVYGTHQSANGDFIAKTVSCMGKGNFIHHVQNPLLIDVSGKLHKRDILNPEEHILFPGSFRQLTYGHLQLCNLIERTLRKRAVFAITTNHPTKGIVPTGDLGDRIRALLGISPILLTSQDRLYLDKARDAPGFHFLIGADVALEILKQKYYNDNHDGLLEALEKFNSLSTRFHVVARKVDNRLITTDDLPIPTSSKHLFIPVPGNWDISSTKILEFAK